VVHRHLCASLNLDPSSLAFRAGIAFACRAPPDGAKVPTSRPPDCRPTVHIFDQPGMLAFHQHRNGLASECSSPAIWQHPKARPGHASRRATCSFLVLGDGNLSTDDGCKGVSVKGLFMPVWEGTSGGDHRLPVQRLDINYLFLHQIAPAATPVIPRSVGSNITQLFLPQNTLARVAETSPLFAQHATDRLLPRRRASLRYITQVRGTFCGDCDKAGHPA